MKVLTNTAAIGFYEPTKDGDIDRMLVKIPVKSTTDKYTILHRLGRTPRKAYIVQMTGGFILCKVSLDSTGREQADAEKITLEFSATGNAVVAFE